MKINHIVIGDAHAKPLISNRRFSWLGRYIADCIVNNPNEYWKIIDMGDWEDMPSLSSFDRGKLAFEGKRYRDDLAVSVEARMITTSFIEEHNWNLKKNKKKQLNNYKFIALGGNHFEGRINKILQDNSWLEGTLRVEDNLCEELGWDYYHYNVPCNHEGIMYTHYWQARGNSNSIGGGKYPAAAILREKLCSTVTGHSHVLDRATNVDGTGNRLFSLVSGCYMDPEQEEDYAGQSNMQWWKGICVLRDVQNGFPLGGEQYIPIDWLKEKYNV